MRFFLLLTGILVICPLWASAQSPQPPEQTPSLTEGIRNLQGPTGGGKQYWCDERLFHGWRIQRNVFTGHHRLLDENDVRHTWGTYEACDAKLEAIRSEQRLPPMKGKAVVLLHGLGRTRGSMQGMAEYLKTRGGYSVFCVGYPSMVSDVGSHAAALDRVIRRLEGIEEIHFVAHSLGNIVIRHYLADTTDPRTGKQGDPRIGRIVMLGPPNGGAEMAERFGRNGLFELITGDSGRQLASEWAALEKNLATPQQPFGIIAGGAGHNPLIEGDDDLVVTVEETKLAGAADFSVLPVKHTFIMDDRTVQRYTERFLRRGYFLSRERRRPLAKRPERTARDG